MDSPQETEPNLVTTGRPPILWGADRPAAATRPALDAQQAGLAAAIRDEARDDLSKLFVALASSLRTRRHVVPLFVRGNAAEAITRQLPPFPDLGQWVLETIVAWADPAATANLASVFTLDASFPIPIPLVLSKAAAAALPVGLPVNQQDTITLTTSGGVVGDRGVVLLIFKREG